MNSHSLNTGVDRDDQTDLVGLAGDLSGQVAGLNKSMFDFERGLESLKGKSIDLSSCCNVFGCFEGGVGHHEPPVGVLNFARVVSGAGSGCFTFQVEFFLTSTSPDGTQRRGNFLVDIGQFSKVKIA